jgi:hypothetical protein
MNEEQIEAIKENLRQIMQAITSMGEEPPPEIQDLLMQVIERAQQQIQQLRQVQEEAETQIQQPSPVSPPINTPSLEESPFPSSNVNSFKYNPKTNQLWVKFHGSQSANSGPTYMYQNVPKNIYDVFSNGRVAPKTSGQNQYHRWIKGVTPSLGASLYALIRNGGYPYQRVS